MFSVAQYARQYRALLKVKYIERKNKGKWVVINPK
jgi:hypothetical protein